MQGAQADVVSPCGDDASGVRERDSSQMPPGTAILDRVPPDSSTCQRSHFRAVLNTATNSSDLHWLYTRDETFNFIVARYRSFTFENNSYCGYEAKEGAEEEKMDVTGEDGNAFF